VVIITAPVLYPQGFRNGNLYMINIVAIPNRFKDGVGKPEHEDILNGFLTEIMIDAVDSGLFKTMSDRLVEGNRGCQIPAERFFHHQARVPGALRGGTIRQVGLAQVPGNGLIKKRGN